MLEDDSPSVYAAGGSFSLDDTELFEDLGCSCDGAGTDSEGFGDLAVGEVDEALAESHGLSGEEREEGGGGGVGDGLDESSDGMRGLRILDPRSGVLH